MNYFKPTVTSRMLTLGFLTLSNMNLIQFESGKIFRKRVSQILLIVSVIIFPVFVVIISQLHAVEDNVPEGLYANHVACTVIMYSQTYFFVPIWIIIFTGQEFSNGHVNRIVFETSKRFYFKSKIVYCGLITSYFTIVGFIALVMSMVYAPYLDFHVNTGFYVQFLVQMIVATLGFSILLLTLVFIFQSPFVAFVTYLGWHFVESMIFTAINGIYKIELIWLPLHLIKTFYTRNGEPSLDGYFFPFTETPAALIPPSLLVVFLIFISYNYFVRNSLKPLSD